MDLKTAVENAEKTAGVDNEIVTEAPEEIKRFVGDALNYLTQIDAMPDDEYLVEEAAELIKEKENKNKTNPVPTIPVTDNFLKQAIAKAADDFNKPAPPVTPQVPVKKEEVAPQRVFDDKDIQDVILALIKKQSKDNPFNKEYVIYGSTKVAFRILADKDLKKLHEIQQETTLKGEKQTTKIYYTAPPTLEELMKFNYIKNSEEIEVYSYYGKELEMQRDELASYIHSIDDDNFFNLTMEEKLEKLNEYSTDFLNYLWLNPLSHFKQLIIQSLLKFKVF